jgi:hypothetical protein
MASLASTFYDSTKTATQSIATAWEKATSVAAATLRSMGGVQADQASAPSPVPSEEKPATPSHIRWARMRSGESELLYAYFVYGEGGADPLQSSSKLKSPSMTRSEQ